MRDRPHIEKSTSLNLYSHYCGNGEEHTVSPFIYTVPLLNLVWEHMFDSCSEFEKQT